MELIEQCLSDLYNTRDEFFICGYFKVLTSQKNERGRPDSGEDECVFERSPQDLGSNVFGTELINLRSAFQCSILNGIKTFGFDDSEMYVSQTGSSTVDYFIASNDLCKQELLESIVVDGNCVESDHLPILSTLQLSPHAPNETRGQGSEVERTNCLGQRQRQSTRVS